MEANMYRSLRRRRGSGGKTGTGTSPAPRQPRKATMKSRDGRKTSRTRSPGRKRGSLDDDDDDDDEEEARERHHRLPPFSAPTMRGVRLSWIEGMWEFVQPALQWCLGWMMGSPQQPLGNGHGAIPCLL